jgi:hypothetical protein
MGFWSWYWLVLGVFCWSVAGLVFVVILGDLVKNDGGKWAARLFRTCAGAACIVLGGPLVWLFFICAATSEIMRRIRRRMSR